MILNVSNKDGKTYKIELPAEKEALVIGKRIGDVLDGGAFGLPGYQLKITGGSDDSGFPMRQDVQGTQKKRPLLSGGVGFNPKRAGERRRKTVRGNTVSQEISQLNLTVVRPGPEPLDGLLSSSEAKEEAAE